MHTISTVRGQSFSTTDAGTKAYSLLIITTVKLHCPYYFVIDTAALDLPGVDSVSVQVLVRTDSVQTFMQAKRTDDFITALDLFTG